MMDGSDFEIDRLEAAEGALDIGELLVGGNRRGGIAISSPLRAKVRSVSVMVSWKCLAIL